MLVSKNTFIVKRAHLGKYDDKKKKKMGTLFSKNDLIVRGAHLRKYSDKKYKDRDINLKESFNINKNLTKKQ